MLAKTVVCPLFHDFYFGIVMIFNFIKMWDSKLIKSLMGAFGIAAASFTAGYQSYLFFSPESIELKEAKKKLASWTTRPNEEYLLEHGFAVNEIEYLVKNKKYLKDLFSAVFVFDPYRQDANFKFNDVLTKIFIDPGALYDIAYIFDKSVVLHKFRAILVGGECKFIREKRLFGEKMVDGSDSGPPESFFLSKDKTSRSVGQISDLKTFKEDGDVVVNVKRVIAGWAATGTWYGPKEGDTGGSVTCGAINFVSPVEDK